MKKLIIALALLIPVSAWSWMNVVQLGGGVESSGDSCSSCSSDQSNSTGDTNKEVSTTGKAVGQSFQVSTSGKLCAVLVWSAWTSGTPAVEVRWGTSSNLGTYEATASSSWSDNTAHWETFTFSNKEDVSALTDYYLGAVITSGASYITKQSDTSVYADGMTYTANDAGWDMVNNDASADIRFEVHLCD